MNKKVITGLAILFAAYMGWSGFQAFMIYNDKAVQQDTINRGLAGRVVTWNGMENDRELWKDTFIEVNDVKQRLELFELAKLTELTDLQIDRSQLFEGDKSIVEYEGSNIGLVKQCVKNSAEGLVAYTDTLTNLVNNISKLETKPDLDFNRINIRQQDGKTLVVFEDMCVLLRGKDEF